MADTGVNAPSLTTKFELCQVELDDWFLYNNGIVTTRSSRKTIEFEAFGRSWTVEVKVINQKVRSFIPSDVQLLQVMLHTEGRRCSVSACWHSVLCSTSETLDGCRRSGMKVVREDDEETVFGSVGPENWFVVPKVFSLQSLAKLKPEHNSFDLLIKVCLTLAVNPYDEWPECEAKMDEGIISMYDDAKFCDVTLVARGQVFRAHRFILAARSDVFRAMFSHDTKENEQGRVDIEDIQPEVVEDLLKYIYTGQAPRMSEHPAELLAAANKYNIAHLQAQCERFLFSTLTLDNAIDTLTTTVDLHGSEQLKNAVLFWVGQAVEHLLTTEAWKQLNPELALAAWKIFLQHKKNAYHYGALEQE